MSIQISFSVNRPPEFHTLGFHYKQALKKKLYNRPTAESGLGSLTSEINDLLRKMAGIPASHSIIMMPSHYYFQVLVLLNVKEWIALKHGLDLNIDVIKPDNLFFLNHVSLENEANRENLKKKSINDIFLSDTDLTTGHFLDPEGIGKLSEDSGKRVHVDISTSLFSRKFNFEHIGSALINTYWFMGHYPGMYLWIVHKGIKQEMMENKPSWFKFLDNYTADHENRDDILIHPESDMVNLYVFKEFLKDIDQRNMTIIRNETTFKAILLYNALSASALFEPLISDESYRSDTIIAAKALMSEGEAHRFFSDKSIQIDHHYHPDLGNIIRIGNFPVHSKEQAGRLTDIIEGV